MRKKRLQRPRGLQGAASRKERLDFCPGRGSRLAEFVAQLFGRQDTHMIFELESLLLRALQKLALLTLVRRRIRDAGREHEEEQYDRRKTERALGHHFYERQGGCQLL
jgi:hypothetical protein